MQTRIVNEQENCAANRSPPQAPSAFPPAPWRSRSTTALRAVAAAILTDEETRKVAKIARKAAKQAIEKFPKL
jgi:hypothetical protein